jgi:hypothetical protein
MRLSSAALLFALSTAPVAPAQAFCGFFVSGADAKLKTPAFRVNRVASAPPWRLQVTGSLAM